MEGPALYVNSIENLYLLPDDLSHHVILLDDSTFRYEEHVFDFFVRARPEGVVSIRPPRVTREVFQMWGARATRELVSESEVFNDLTWIHVHNDAAHALMNSIGFDLDSLRHASLSGGYEAIDDLTVSANISWREEPLGAPNVIAELQGSDPALRNTYVVVTAHFDHVGGTAGGDQDEIFNGADDNASGTAALIEVARAFARLSERPPRSIISLAVSGEERGFLGSTHFAESTTDDREIVAGLSLDMIGRNAPDSLYTVGGPYTDLGQFAQSASSRPGVELHISEATDPTLYYSSDHVSFAVRGIPALLFTAGLHPEYHTPRDEAELVNADKVARAARLAFYTALSAASASVAPRWTPVGREFVRKYGW